MSVLMSKRVDVEGLTGRVTERIVDTAAEAVYTTIKELGERPNIGDVVADTVLRLFSELMFDVSGLIEGVRMDVEEKVDEWLARDRE